MKFPFPLPAHLLRSELVARLSTRFRALSQRQRLLTMGGAALLLIVTLSWLFGGTSPADDLPTVVVQRGPLRINLVESGTIRPRQQLVLRNETNRTVNITKITPEGTLVKRGDILLQFEETEMLNQLVERRIRVQNAESSLITVGEDLKAARIQAEADSESAHLAETFAQLDLEKYLQGDRPQQIKALETKITLTQEEHNLAKERLRWSSILFGEKYLSQSDLQRDELAAKKSALNLELALEDLRLYNAYTGQRQLAEIESRVNQTRLALERTLSRTTGNIAQQEARFRASEAGAREEIARLKREEDEATKFAVRAPINGMVLYASSVDGRWRGDPVEVGLSVRPNTEIIYLPTADEYDVDVLISEVNVGKLVTGQVARIKIDAMPDAVFQGRLETISALPDASSRWMNPNLKLYKTAIALAPSERPLRNGMSCQVEILVADLPDTLFIPLQCVVREQGQSVVYVRDGRRPPRAQNVRVGLDNNRMVQILEGLEAGQTVLLAPPLSRSSGAEAEAVPPAETPATAPAPATTPAPATAADST